MAIAKTVFTGRTSAENAPETYTWLQANATDYFDSITLDSETNVITCASGETADITIEPGIAGVIKATLDNGVGATTIGGHTTTASYVREAYKTAKGIALVLGTDTNIFMYAFIFKSNVGTTSFVSHVYNSASSNNVIHFADLINSRSIANYPVSNLGHAGTLTSLASVPLNADSYADGLYYIAFREYTQRAILLLDGKRYVSNIYFALEE